MTGYSKISFTEQGIPRSEIYGDFYFSTKGPVEEKKYVFLDGNGLPKRWENFPVFKIGETGFGCGLSFMLVWDLWKKMGPALSQLHFYSFEKHPLLKEDWKKVLELWPELQPMGLNLVSEMSSLERGWNKRYFSPNVTLNLYIGEAIHGLKSCSESMHCWFLDGFSPAKNPDLWSDEIISAVASHTVSAGTLATYTATSAVKSKLIKEGFVLNQRAGFGGEREMIAGYKKSA